MSEPKLKRVVFVCVENSNRSQMAEAFARIHGGGKVEAYSAGSRPSGRVNPRRLRNAGARLRPDPPHVERIGGPGGRRLSCGGDDGWATSAVHQGEAAARLAIPDLATWRLSNFAKSER